MVDLRRERVHRDGTDTPLTTLEAELLRHMSERPSQPISTEALLMEVWGYRSQVRSRAAANTVSRLRNKIELDPANPRHLITVYGEGYRFEPLAPEELAAASALVVPAVAPVLTETPPKKTNLTHRRTRFVGREAELDRLEAAVARGGIITLLGTGGVGKTRLAQELGLRCVDRFEGGVWFVELAAARAEDDIHLAVAQVLGVHLPEGGQTQGSRDYLARVLAQRAPCMLILDNAEQLAAILAEVVEAWSGQAPDAVVVLTSRTRIGVEGESVLELAGLEDPHAQTLLTDRLTALGLDISETHGASISAISQLLEGIPLALELACARARTLGLAQIVERLEAPMSALGRRTTDDRHGSMWAAVQWSWDLLAPVEQLGLAQLSMFQGTFDLEMAEAILDFENDDRDPPVDQAGVLHALVDSSTVERIRDTQPPHFRILLPIREFATDKLVGRTRSETWERYTSFFLGRARVSRTRHGETGPSHLRLVESGLDELLHIAEDARDPIVQAEAIWHLRPKLLEAGLGPRLSQLLSGIDLGTLDGELRPAMAISQARSLLSRARFAEAHLLLNEIRGSAGVHESWRLETLAWALLMGGDADAAAQAADEALASLEAPVGPIASRILGHRGVIAHQQGDLDKAHSLIQQALAALRGADHSEAARCHLRLGNLEQDLGRYQDSKASLSRSIEISQRRGMPTINHIARCALAAVAVETDGLDAALEQRAANLDVGRTLSQPLAICQLTAVLAVQAVGEDRVETARSLLTECRGMLASGLPPRLAGFVQVGEAMVLHLEGRLAEAETGYRAGLEALRTIDDNVRQQLMPFGAVALAQAGKLEDAREWLAEIERVDGKGTPSGEVAQAWIDGQPCSEVGKVTTEVRTLRRLIAVAPLPSSAATSSRPA